MNYTLTTLQRSIKSILLVIVSALIFAQFAAANHVHDSSENTPESPACSICIVTSHDDGDLDPPLPTPVSPSVIDIAEAPVLILSETQSAFKLEHKKAPAPPDVSPSAPRAPPH